MEAICAKIDYEGKNGTKAHAKVKYFTYNIEWKFALTSVFSSVAFNKR